MMTRTRLRSAEVANLFDGTNENELYTSAYVRRWVQRSGLWVLKPRTVKCTWDRGGAFGLTMLFIQWSMLESIRDWTSQKIVQKGRGPCLLIQELYACTGLEHAGSLVKAASVKEM